MADDKNIARHFRKVAWTIPETVAICGPEVNITYRQLAMIADSFAYHLASHGVGREALVALDTKDTIVSLGITLAASHLGAQITTLDRHLLSAKAVCPKHFIRSTEIEGLPDLPYIIVDASWSPQFAKTPISPDYPWPGFASDDDPAWIVRSSGTTGRPKYLALGQSLVHDRVCATMNDFVAGETVMAALFSCNSRPYMVRAIAALLSGCKIVEGFDPEFMQQAGVNLLYAAPRQIEVWMQQRRLSPPIEKLQLSGSRLDTDLTMRLLESFNDIEDIYGSAETMKSFATGKWLEKGTLRSAKRLVEGQIEILDANDNPCQIGEIGTVRIRNRFMATGYLGDRAASDIAFRDGWFYPGDRAKLGENGELIIEGRKDDIVNLGGEKIDLNAIDTCLQGVPCILRAVCFRNPIAGQEDSVAAIVMLNRVVDPDDCIREAHRICLETLGPVFAPRQILVVQRIPLTDDGMPRRKDCRDELQRVVEYQSRSGII